MAQLEEGWPLGLQPLNNNVRVIGEGDYFGSTSFNTLLSSASTTSSTDFSSDLDTESTGSFFHDKSTTLGRLMGVSTPSNLPRRRSLRLTRRRTQMGRATKSTNRPKRWCFSLCSMNTTDAAQSPNNNDTNYLVPSLGQFLAVERRTGNGPRSLGPIVIGPDEIALAQPESNSLFVNGFVAPPRASPLFAPRGGRREEGEIVGGEGHAAPLMFSCMCG